MPYTTIPAAGQFGALPDAAPQELPPNAWSSALNMRFRDGYAERVGGQVQVFTTPSVTPYFVTPYTYGSTRYWVHAGTAHVYVDDGTTRTDITPVSPFTGGVDNRWTGGVLGGVLVLNNGVDAPQYWGGNVANKLATLTDWNANWKAAVVRPFKNFLVALDVTKSGTRYGSMVKWSHEADPGTIPAHWDETLPQYDAGETDISETPDLLVDCLQLGDINVLYKERSMYGMQYIGAPYIWRFFRLPGEYGLLARGCVVDTPKGHVVLSAGDVVLHNGQGPNSILTGRYRKWLFANMDSTYYARSFLATNPRRNEVYICFPWAGQSVCTHALVWNWVDDTLGDRELPNATYGASGQLAYGTGGSWVGDTDEWIWDSSAWTQDDYAQAESRLLLSTTAPLINLVDTGAYVNGTPFTAKLERTGLTFDDPESVKTIRSIVPRVDGSAGAQIYVQVGASMDAEQPPTWQSPVTYTVGSTRKADTFATGRYLAVRIYSTDPRAWRIKSFDADVVSRGLY